MIIAWFSLCSGRLQACSAIFSTTYSTDFIEHIYATLDRWKWLFLDYINHFIFNYPYVTVNKFIHFSKYPSAYATSNDNSSVVRTGVSKHRVFPLDCGIFSKILTKETPHLARKDELRMGCLLWVHSLIYGDSIKTSWHETACSILALWEGKPPVPDGFP